MDEWDDEFIHAEGPAHLKFAADQVGSFRFGYVHCEIDYRVAERDGRPAVDFSFEGTDEMDPTSGRGWAVPDDEQLHGVLFFHSASGR